MFSLLPTFNWKPYLLLLSGLLMLLMTALFQALKMPTSGILDVSVFHLPGEAVFLELPQGHRVLIDAGETPEVAGKLMQRLPFWERSLDAVVLTHGDRDHIAGMPAILGSFAVGSILLPGTAQDSPLSEAIRRMARERNIPLVFLDESVDFKIGEVIFDTLAPAHAFIGKTIPKQNRSSAVIRVHAGKNAILLAGDIEAKEEKKLLTSPVKLVADTLKVPHHGSKSSSTTAFLAGVRPQTALVSAHKNNPFDHPASEISTRYHDANITFLVTRELGDITFPIISAPKNFFSF